MKLYCTTYVDWADHCEQCNTGHKKARWCGTQVDQKRDVKDLKSQNMEMVEPQQFDVPTDKAGLLSWLNERGVRP